MKKSMIKRGAAFVLSGLMIIGCGISAMASSNSDDIEGIGYSEGHVDGEATSVLLPTDATGTTFAYTMDPERLISRTSHEKYGDAVIFPASGDTGVYFNTGAKGGDGADKDYIVYQNTSSALSVTNMSSHSIELTVKAEAITVDVDTDIPLVGKSAYGSADEASLYLGLIVANDDPVAIKSDAAVMKTVVIPGTDGNFTVTTNAAKDGYEFREMTVAEYNEANNLTGDNAATDLSWSGTSFKLEGGVTARKEIKANTTAPTVKITWSWIDPDENAAPSASRTKITRAELDAAGDAGVVINLDLGKGSSGVTAATSLQWNNPDSNNTFLEYNAGPYGNANVTLDPSANTVTIKASAFASGKRIFRIIFDNDPTKYIDLIAGQIS